MQSNDVKARLAQLGGRLRTLRVERGLSLLDIERMSEGALKGVVIGSYERGDRNVTITRLSEIADFYNVRLADLISDLEPDPSPAREVEAALAGAGVAARVTGWHHQTSATRGVTIRLEEVAAQRLADVIHLSAAARLTDAGYVLRSPGTAQRQAAAHPAGS